MASEVVSRVGAILPVSFLHPSENLKLRDLNLIQCFDLPAAVRPVAIIFRSPELAQKVGPLRGRGRA